MKQFIIGIDEAGRGPIAGPVSVAAFHLGISNYRLRKIKLPLRDSKKLTPLQREAWFREIKNWKREGNCQYAVSLVSAKTIDRIGIVKAIRCALARSLGKIPHECENTLILLDGALYAPDKYKNQKTIIRGDEKIPIISFASIVAKVHRDRHMMRLANKFPQFGFEMHKGYGTPKHYQKIKKIGFTSIHRSSFLSKLAVKQ